MVAEQSSGTTIITTSEKAQTPSEVRITRSIISADAASVVPMRQNVHAPQPQPLPQAPIILGNHFRGARSLSNGAQGNIPAQNNLRVQNQGRLEDPNTPKNLCIYF